MQDDTYVEPYIPEVPVAPAAAPAHAPSYVEQPHTVVNNVTLMFYQMSFSSLILILYGLFSMS